MKAAFYTTNGGPEVLRYGDVPDPQLRDGQVLVKVHAVSLEGGDLINRRNTPPRSDFHVVGYQAAGTVERIGPDVTGIAPGDRVCGFSWSGSHAELFAVRQDLVFPIPDGVDFATASTVPVTFGTACEALFECGMLAAGQTVLIQGAAGGVGLAAVQLAKGAGATVLGTASDRRRLQRLEEFGLDHGIDYSTKDVGKRALQLTDGKGVDLVVDLAGGRGLAQLLQAVRYRGRLAIVGAASGEEQSLGFIDIVSKGLTVCGCLFGREMHTPRAREIVSRMYDGIAAGRLRMPIERVYPLAEAALAHSHAETGHPFGRIVLAP